MSAVRLGTGPCGLGKLLVLRFSQCAGEIAGKLGPFTPFSGLMYQIPSANLDLAFPDFD